MRKPRRQPLSDRARIILREVITLTDEDGASPSLADLERSAMPSTANSVLTLENHGLVKVIEGRIVPTGRGRQLAR